MQLYHDIRIGRISVVVKKTEGSDFWFNCTGRNFDGFIFVTDGDGVFIDESGEHPLKKNSVMILSNKSKYLCYQRVPMENKNSLCQYTPNRKTYIGNI